MSFSCQIWEYPAPRDSAEVKLILEALQGPVVHDLDLILEARRKEEGQHPRFVELAKRLTARHPCITTLADDEEELGVWSDGPLDGRTSESVYSIGIQTDHLVEVYPFVCETANELGLNVWNMHDGVTNRADGVELEAGDLLERRVASNGLDLTRLTQWLQAQLEPVAARHGFRKIGYHPVRGIDGGWQAFVAGVMEYRGNVVVDVNVTTYRYDVMRMVHKLDPRREAGDAHGAAFSLSACEFHKTPLVIKDPGDMVAVVRTMKPIVERQLLPAADECSMLAGLDRVMNTGRTFMRNYPLNHLVVSRLVDSPAFEALYETLREQGHIDDSMEPFYRVMRRRLEVAVPSIHAPGGS